MKAEWINPFVLSTATTFRQMLDCDVTRGNAEVKTGCQPTFEISGVMSLTGQADGTVVLTFSRDVALSATEKMIGDKPTQIDECVRDVVGELTNIVAGSAKSRIKELNLTVGLPTVVQGKNHIISFPAGVAVVSIPFQSTWGPFSVEVGLRER